MRRCAKACCPTNRKAQATREAKAELDDGAFEICCAWAAGLEATSKLIYKRRQERRSTYARGNSASNGTYALRGFYGDYEVTVTYGGKTHKATAKWRRDGDEVVKLP